MITFSLLCYSLVEQKKPTKGKNVIKIQTTTETIESKDPALSHQKCYRKELMPQIENVTQIKLRIPVGGYPNGVNHERKKRQ